MCFRSTGLPLCFMLKPILRANLDVLFVGFNPHPYSWERGRYYAHGSLWRILRKSGLAPDIQNDSQLFDYNFGITDLIHDRPTREAKEIPDADYAVAVLRFRRQLTRLAPRVACFTGKERLSPFCRSETQHGNRLRRRRKLQKIRSLCRAVPLAQVDHGRGEGAPLQTDRARVK